MIDWQPVSVPPPDQSWVVCMLSEDGLLTYEAGRYDATTGSLVIDLRELEMRTPITEYTGWFPLEE